MPPSRIIPLPSRRHTLLLTLILLQITFLAFAEGRFRLGAFMLNLDDGWTSCFYCGSSGGLFANIPNLATLPGLHIYYYAEADGVSLLIECHWLLLTLLSLPVIPLTLAGIARLRRILSPYMLQLPPLPFHLLVATLFVALASFFAWKSSNAQAECSIRLWKAWIWIFGGNDGVVQVEIPFFELKPPHTIDLNYVKIFLGYKIAGSTQPLLVVATRWWLIPPALSLSLLPIVIYRATRKRHPSAFPVTPAPSQSPTV